MLTGLLQPKSRKQMKKLSFPLALLLMLSVWMQADTLRLYFNQSATDNLFQSSFPESDYLSSLGFSLDKNLGSTSLFAAGSYAYLYENPDLTYYTQDVGLDHVWVLNEKSGLYASLTGRGTFYRSDYDDFNYLAANAFTAYKSYLSPTSILKAEYALTLRDYRSSQFDFLSQSLGLSWDKFFQSRTTLKAGLSWGYKYYMHPYAETEDISIPESGMISGPGMGRGRQGGMMYVPGSHPLPQENGTGQGIQTMTFSTLLAQGLSDAIGLRFTGARQWSLSGKNPFSQVWEFYAVENPFYDRFSWDGYELGGQITALFPWDVQLKLGFDHSRKNFPGIEVLDAEGLATGIMREDTRALWQARVEKNFARYSLFLTYNLVNNRSNDPLFDWQGNFLALGIEWNLFFGENQ